MRTDEDREKLQFILKQLNQEEKQRGLGNGRTEMYPAG